MPINRIMKHKLVIKLMQSWWGKLIITAWIGKGIPFYIWLFKQINWSLLLLWMLLVSNITIAQNPLVDADKWYNKRADGRSNLEASANPIDNAIREYKKAVLIDSLYENATLGLIKSYYFKATYVPLSRSDRKELYNRGKNLGEELLRKNPKSKPALYWLAAHWGMWGESYGVLASARQGVAGKIRNLCEKLIRIDPEFGSAGGYRILGLTHLYAPRIPLILSWPSNKYSEVCLEKAVLTSPNNPSNKLSLVKVYLKLDKVDQAIQLLMETVTCTPRESFYLEDYHVIAMSREMLLELGGQDLTIAKL